MKKLLIGIGVLVLVAVAGLLIYQNTVFRLVKTKPSNNNQKASPYEPITFQFNKDLAEHKPASSDGRVAAVNAIETTPYINGKLTISGNVATYTPISYLNINKTYKVRFYNIASSDGHSLPDVEIQFHTIFVSYDRLPKTTQKDMLANTDRTDSANPLTALLPYETLHYKITYIYDAQDNPKYTITLYAILNNASQLASYQQQLKDYKAEAFAWINSKGVDPKTLKITYDPAIAVSY
jgi:hypothetical protein